MVISCVSQLLPERKPCWRLVRILWPSTWSRMCLQTMCTKTLYHHRAPLRAEAVAFLCATYLSQSLDLFDFFALLNLLRLTLYIRFRPLLNNGRLVQVEVSLLGMCSFMVKAMNSLNMV